MDYLTKNMLPTDGDVYKTKNKKTETKKNLENFYEDDK
jgi:hypothetical protein